MIKKNSIVGNWLVISDRFKKNNIYWNECECICGKRKEVRTWHLNNNKTKGCGCTNIKNRFKFKGIGELSKAYFYRIKSSSKKRNKYFDDNITLEYLWDLFLKQDRKCALSNIPINLDPKWSENNKKKNKSIQTASLDRIDNTKGYTKNNIHWIHKDINFMKGSLSIKDFLNYCEKINYNKLFSEK